MREKINLNFGWKYSETFSEDMIKKSYSDKDFETVDIPHTNKEIPYNYFDEKMYQFVSCYRKHFKFDKEKLNGSKRVLLHFEGASVYAKVYINGSFAGEHKGAYTPFVFDITDFLASDNVITVMLDSTERNEIPPFGNVVDYLVYGGIYREVWMEVVDDIRVEDVFITTEDVLNEKKVICADITFSHHAQGELSLELLDSDKKVIREKKCGVKARILKIKWRVGGVKLWDLDAPNLYTLRVKFGDDVTEYRFGFRSCEFTRFGFKLNGRTVKIIGLNRHQSYPYVGYAMPASAQKADADLLKFKLGCNLVRTSHYPDSVHFLDRCDEIGLLVFTEMPSWQYLGEGEWRKNCLDNIESMILRDRNHPSVILWGVRVNEGQDCDEFYKETNALARKLDPSRQTGGVRNMPQSSFLEDVYTYNDFSHSGGKIALLPSLIVCGLKPYLVTENNGHMYPTKTFDREELRTEHALRHARVQNALFGSKRISGAIGWCMADYNTHKDFGSGDRICYHGVTDMFRIPKLAASVFSSQQDKSPVMETSSSMDIGDYPGGIIGLTYIFTNCDEIKVYKNGRYTSSLTPKDGKLKHLPHPPVSPVDYLGNVLEEEEGLDPITAKYLKNALIAAGKYGYIMPVHHYIEVAIAFLHGRMTFNQIYDLITKYFANWGNEQVEYKYEGYKNGELIKTITRTAVKSTHISVSADSDTLIEDETYDVTRIEILALDQNDNRLPYCNSAVNVSVEGPAEIIGPDEFSLIGGVRAFWVRTVGKSGDVKVRIKTESQPEQIVELKVIKK